MIKGCKDSFNFLGVRVFNVVRWFFCVVVSGSFLEVFK